MIYIWTKPMQTSWSGQLAPDNSIWNTPPIWPGSTQIHSTVRVPDRIDSPFFLGELPSCPRVPGEVSSEAIQLFSFVPSTPCCYSFPFCLFGGLRSLMLFEASLALSTSSYWELVGLLSLEIACPAWFSLPRLRWWLFHPIRSQQESACRKMPITFSLWRSQFS